MVVETISTALSALKISVEMAKTAVAIRDDNKIAEATQLLNERIIGVQNAALHLQDKLSTQRDEIEALKDAKREAGTQIAELEQRASDRAKYKLHELSEGIFVLAHVEGGDAGNPMHYLCQSCMDNASKKVVLQTTKNRGRILLHCTVCDNNYDTGRTYTMQSINPNLLAR